VIVEDEKRSQAMKDGRFGCDQCCGDDPQAAKNVAYTGEAAIVDSSHFSLQVRRCPYCRQGFLFVFTEFIDWENGDDPQYCDLMPITEDEVRYLKERGEDVDLKELMRWSQSRRVLQWGDSGLTWKTGGILIMYSTG
jgi:hypothetical protein